MARKGGMTESTVHLLNPMPNVSGDELAQRAGLTLYRDRVANKPFEFRKSTRNAAGLETLSLAPGEAMPLREFSEADQVMKGAREAGIVKVVDISDEVEVLRESLNGLQRAKDYFRNIDRTVMMTMLTERNIPLDEATIERYKGDYYPYLINDAKAQFIEERIFQISDRLAELGATGKAPKKKVAVNRPSTTTVDALNFKTESAFTRAPEPAVEEPKEPMVSLSDVEDMIAKAVAAAMPAKKEPKSAPNTKNVGRPATPNPAPAAGD